MRIEIQALARINGALCAAWCWRSCSMSKLYWLMKIRWVTFMSASMSKQRGNITRPTQERGIMRLQSCLSVPPISTTLFHASCSQAALHCTTKLINTVECVLPQQYMCHSQATARSISKTSAHQCFVHLQSSAPPLPLCSCIHAGAYSWHQGTGSQPAYCLISNFEHQQSDTATTRA